MPDDPLDPGRFGAGDPFSLGVEEELHLVDPVTGALRNSGGDVFERLETPARGEVEREVHACQLELITDVCDTVGDAMGVLGELRRAVLATGTGVVGSGTHPTAEEGEAEITDKERYQLVRELLGDAIATPVSALHVHVGMPDAATAIRAFNGMRRHLALLEALSANAPYRHGRDTDLASAREITLRAWPRSGAPRAMTDYDDFAAFARRLTTVADVPGLHVPLVEAAAAPEARDGRDPRARRPGRPGAHRRAGRRGARARAPRGARRPGARPAAGDPRGGVLPRRPQRRRRAAPGRRGPAAAGAGAAGADAGARAAERARAGLRGRARRAPRRWSRPAAAPACSAGRRAIRPTRRPCSPG